MDRISRYQILFETADGYPFFQQTLWVPESDGERRGWGNLFDGPAPARAQDYQVLSITLRPGDPYSPNLTITRS